MFIQMLVSLAVDSDVLIPGDVVEVDNRFGTQCITAGYARPYVESASEATEKACLVPQAENRLATLGRKGNKRKGHA